MSEIKPWLSNYVENMCACCRIYGSNELQMRQVCAFGLLDPIINPNRNTYMKLEENLLLIGSFNGAAVHAFTENDDMVPSIKNLRQLVWSGFSLGGLGGGGVDIKCIILTQRPTDNFYIYDSGEFLICKTRGMICFTAVNISDVIGFTGVKVSIKIGFLNYDKLYDVTNEYVKLRDGAKEILNNAIESLK